MRRTDLAASYMNGRCDDLIRRNLFHKQAYRRNIRDSIHSSHFMEMHIRDRLTVSMAFRFCNQPVYLQDMRSGLFRHIQILHDMLDAVQTDVMMCVAVFMLVMMIMIVIIIVVMVVRMFVLMIMFVVVMIMVMVMIMFVVMLMLMVMFVVMLMLVMVIVLFSFHLTVDADRDMGSRNAALNRRGSGNRHIRDTDCIQFLKKRILVRQQFHESRREHITRSAHSKIQIQQFHFSFMTASGCVRCHPAWQAGSFSFHLSLVRSVSCRSGPSHALRIAHLSE